MISSGFLIEKSQAMGCAGSLPFTSYAEIPKSASGYMCDFATCLSSFQAKHWQYPLFSAPLSSRDFSNAHTFIVYSALRKKLVFFARTINVYGHKKNHHSAIGAENRGYCQCFRLKITSYAKSHINITGSRFWNALEARK